jgi:hypothetical protein
LELHNLGATEGTITANNFNFALAAATASWLIDNLAAVATTAFPGPNPIYTKAVNKLWSWTSELTIDGTIPGWTPAWSYSGNLELLIQ